MNNKQNILDNVAEYSAEDLVEYIKAGVVTMDELIHDTDGEFSPGKRKEVKYLLENGDEDDWLKAKASNDLNAVQRYLDAYPEGKFRNEARALKAQIEQQVKEAQAAASTAEAWEMVDKGNRDSLNNFINQYPDSPHAKEAAKLINEIDLGEIMGLGIGTMIAEIKKFETQQGLTPEQKGNNIINTVQRYLNREIIKKQEVINAIAEDHNLLNAYVVKQLVNNGTLTLQDLQQTQIDVEFIRKMMNYTPAMPLPDPKPIEGINKQSTEIYFWGIPSSGKSCALGAILSVAASGRVAPSMDPDVASQGYGYMNRLINLFQYGQVGSLMAGNALTSFYEMGFDLVDNDNRVHPITCIDMAGELMRCMYKSNAGEALSVQDLQMLDTMNKVLTGNRGVNHKLHFFVVEYGAEDRLYEGLPQLTYLQGAMSYIKNTQIFDKDTNGVYLLITKADKAKNLTKEGMSEYVENKYKGFYNNLVQICKSNEINKGNVQKIAFSLGDVCFQNYCKFNPRPAENVVNIILERTASYKQGKMGWFSKKLRG